MRRLFVIVFGLVVLAASAVAPAAGAQTGSLTFDPSTVVAGGGKLFINGTCEPNTTGFVISNAFAHQPSVGDFAGVPAIAIQTGADGTFGIGLTIDPSVKPGHYAVTLRCGGGLAASGTLTVQPLPLASTGAPTTELVILGAAVAALGALLAIVSRRRAPV
jgi:LPXTG-motif cell wall-anchored protein